MRIIRDISKKNQTNTLQNISQSIPSLKTGTVEKASRTGLNARRTVNIQAQNIGILFVALLLKRQSSTYAPNNFT